MIDRLHLRRFTWNFGGKLQPSRCFVFRRGKKLWDFEGVSTLIGRHWSLVPALHPEQKKDRNAPSWFNSWPEIISKHWVSHIYQQPFQKVTYIIIPKKKVTIVRRKPITGSRASFPWGFQGERSPNSPFGWPENTFFPNKTCWIQQPWGGVERKKRLKSLNPKLVTWLKHPFEKYG